MTKALPYQLRSLPICQAEPAKWLLGIMGAKMRHRHSNVLQSYNLAVLGNAVWHDVTLEEPTPGSNQERVSFQHLKGSTV